MFARNVLQYKIVGECVSEYDGVCSLLQVTVSPFKAIVDLKKEVSRVYHLHYPQKTLVVLHVTATWLTTCLHYREECKYIQDGSGYLVCDDYQVGLVFNNYDSVFALTASQPLDKYSDQWKSSDSSAKLSGAGMHARPRPTLYTPLKIKILEAHKMVGCALWPGYRCGQLQLNVLGVFIS